MCKTAAVLYELAKTSGLPLPALTPFAPSWVFNVTTAKLCSINSYIADFRLTGMEEVNKHNSKDSY